MNRYFYPMFYSYLYPTILFFYVPLTIFIVANIGDKSVIVSGLVWVSCFSVALFGSGLIFAPIIGPRLSKRKSLSFLMAAICQILATLSFVVAVSFPEFDLNLEITGFLFSIFFAYGLFPSMLAGFLFIGSCKKMEKI